MEVQDGGSDTKVGEDTKDFGGAYPFTRFVDLMV
jgi:hypothetical protein